MEGTDPTARTLALEPLKVLLLSLHRRLGKQTVQPFFGSQFIDLLLTAFRLSSGGYGDYGSYPAPEGGYGAYKREVEDLLK